MTQQLMESQNSANKYLAISPKPTGKSGKQKRNNIELLNARSAFEL